MNLDETPYVAQCRRCEQGLLRFWQCGQCRQFVVICDECELVWRQIAAVSQHADTPADAAYPDCPWCAVVSRHWIRPNFEQLREADLEQWIAGWSC